jgi:predicted hydrolase (HD superfamily)
MPIDTSRISGSDDNVANHTLSKPNNDGKSGSFDRSQAESLLKQYVESPALRRHCYMVAVALEAYAQHLLTDQNQNKNRNKTENKLGEEIVSNSIDPETWYIAGLLHDLDWEKYPDQHPLEATQEILPVAGCPDEIIQAIKSHAPQRTGVEPTTLLDRYLFACDELSGFLDAVAKVRPDGFKDLKYSSVKKKLKNKSFAANVSREDIALGAQLINQELADHTEFLVKTFADQKIPS